MALNLNDYLETMITKVMHSPNGSVLAGSLLKWKPLIYSTILKLMKVTKRTQEEAFQDLMVPLARISSLYPVILYRYDGKIYEEVERDGKLVKLTTVRYNKQKTVTIWVREEKVERVKKAKFSSLIYNKIRQEACVMNRAHFTQKNGYEVTKITKTKVKTNSTKGPKSKTVDFKEVQKFARIYSLGDSCVSTNDSEGDRTYEDVIASDSISPEVIAEGFDTFTSVSEAISLISKKALAYIYEKPEITSKELRQKLKVTNKKLGFIRREIKEATDKYQGLTRKSAYAPYAIYEDNYYYLDESYGSVVVIRLGDSKKYVNRDAVKIEEEMSYRTPVHFSADLI